MPDGSVLAVAAMAAILVLGAQTIGHDAKAAAHAAKKHVANPIVHALKKL